jgi:hypothetical protein
MALAPEVRARFQASHGLYLPDHAFRFYAFWLAATDLERAALDRVGVAPGAIFERFEADPAPKDPAHDRRLDGRFYRAPPELLHAAWGDTDGLHWGLWYDHDGVTDPPVAGFYARDGGGGSFYADTLLGLVIERASRLEADGLQAPSLSDAERAEHVNLAGVLAAAARWFEPDAAATSSRRRGVADTLDDFGALLPDDAAPLPDRGPQHAIWDTTRDDDAAVARWIAEAEAGLADGQPGFALVLGRDLHWLSMRRPEREAAAAALLVAAYEALGRPALAAIARVHAGPGRHLPGVGIY